MLESFLEGPAGPACQILNSQVLLTLIFAIIERDHSSHMRAGAVPVPLEGLRRRRAAPLRPPRGRLRNDWSNRPEPGGGAARRHRRLRLPATDGSAEGFGACGKTGRRGWNPWSGIIIVSGSPICLCPSSGCQQYSGQYSGNRSSSGRRAAAAHRGDVQRLRREGAASAGCCGT